MALNAVSYSYPKSDSNTNKEVYMKQYIKRFVVFAVVLTLILGLMPGGSAQAAKKKKTKTITVTTQEELVAALKKYKSSGSTVTIKIETTEKSTFTLNAKYSSDLIKIVVDAPNATFKSKATVSSITINEAKSVKEYASGNKITVNDEKLTFTAMPTASVEKLTIASETGTVKVVNNGGIEKVAVKSEVKVNLTQNGEVGRVYVGAAADISVSGTAEENLKVTVQKDVVGASVKSEVPVSVNAYGTVDLTLEKGAESSKVTVKEETAGVKLENKTEETVSVKDSDGKTQKVETGEELTSDNYVGKTDETETPVGETETEQPKEEEKKEEEKNEEKEEEKKDDTTTDTPVSGGTSGGGSSGGTSTPDPYVPPVTTLTAEEKLINELKTAGSKAKPDSEPEKVYLTSDVTLTKEDITIPVNVVLYVGYNGSKAILNTNSKKISIQETGTIIVTPGSKLVAAEKSLDLVPTAAKENEEADGGIDIMAGAEVKVGGYTFTAGNGPSESNSDKPAARLHWLRKYDTKHDDQANRDFSFELRFVEIQNISGNVQITGESGCTEIGLTDAFGLNHLILPDDLDDDFGKAWEACNENDVLSALSYIYVSDVRVTDYVTKLNDTKVYGASNSTADWLNAYLDTERYEELQEAIALGRTPLVNVTLSDTKDSNNKITSRVATLNATDNSQDVRIYHTVTIPVGTTLIAKVPIVAPNRGGRIDVFGTLKSENAANDGLGVTSEMYVGDHENVDPHELVMLMGWYGKYILNNGATYYHEFVFPKDPEKVATPDMVEGIDCIGFTIQARKKYGSKQNGIYYYWSYRSIDADYAKDIPHLLVMKKANGASEGKEVIPNPFGYDFIELDTLKAGYRSITDQFEFERFLDWAWMISEIYIKDRFGGNPDDQYISYAQLYKATKQGGYVNFVHDEFSTDASCSIVLDTYINEWGTERNDYHLASADLTITKPANSATDALRIKKDCELNVERGATLIVPSILQISSNDNATKGKSLIMEYDTVNNNGARLNVIRGGSIQIGDIKISVPDNCIGWNEKGDPGLSITADYDDINRTPETKENYLRIQIPENAVIKKVAQNGELSDPTDAELNDWLSENNMRLDIAYSSCYSDAFFELEEKVRNKEAEEGVLEPFREEMNEKDSWHVRHIKLGDKIAIVEYDQQNVPIVKSLTLPNMEGDYYNVTTMDELIAVYLYNESSKAAGIQVKINPPADGNFDEQDAIDFNCKIDARWSIVVPADKKLMVTPGAAIVGAFEIASGGAIDVQVYHDNDVDSYGELRTCENGSITIQAGGALRVHNGSGMGNPDVKGKVVSGNGGKVYVENGGSFSLDGTYECGCNQSGPSLVISNSGSVVGSGTIELYPEKPEYVIPYETIASTIGNMVEDTITVRYPTT